MNSSRVSIPSGTTVTLDIVNGDLEIGEHATVKGAGSRQESRSMERSTVRATTPLIALCPLKSLKLRIP